MSESRSGEPTGTPDTGTSAQAPDTAAPPYDPSQDPNNPYRFGLPDHPIAPEYAPPGYVPPPPPAPPRPTPPPQGFGDYRGHSPYPPPPPGPPRYSGRPGGRRRGKPSAALAFGVASILLCWLVVFDLIPIIAGIVFGALGAGESRRNGDESGRRMAIIGIICAAVGALLAILVGIWFYNKVRDCMDLPYNSAGQRSCIRDHL